MRYMGIDYGTRRIGIALSDVSGSMAFPESVMENHGLVAVAQEILAMCALKNVGTIVLGESKNFRGEANAVMGDITELKRVLEKEIPVRYENETFTSAEASRGAPSEGLLDASAAAIILNTYLVRMRTGSPGQAREPALD